MVGTVELERYMTHISVFYIIICEFGHGEKLYPVLLHVVNICSKINLYNAILSYGRTVCLWLEGNGECLFSA